MLARRTLGSELELWSPLGVRFRKPGYFALIALSGVWGCGHVAHHDSGSGGMHAGGGSVAEAGAPTGAGTGGAPAPPVVSCGTSSRDLGDPIVEICAAEETCCNCGCGPDDAACSREPACAPPSMGQRCGNDTCREGYVCCNAICGICAKSAEACTTVAGHCQAVGMDPSFDRCSDVFPTGAGGGSLGTLETLLPRFHGRWLLCNRETPGPAEDEVAGFDITSDGHYFMLARQGDHYVRRDTATTRGALVLPGPGLPLPELDFRSEVGATLSVLLFISDDPRGVWVLPGPPADAVGGHYLIDPTASVE